MSQFCRFGTAVLFFLFQTFLYQASSGQVLTARFKSITPNTNAYYEYLPQGYNPSDTARYPLLIHLIGAGDLGTGTPSQITLLLRSGPIFEVSSGVFPDPVIVNGKSFGFIIIDPQFMVQPSVTDVNSVINYAIANYHVDTTRIYLTGLSMGGGVCWQYSGYQPSYANRLAAIVPVCGDITPDLGRARIIAASNLPVWATHNNQDPEVPAAYTEQEIAYINEPPAPVPPAMLTIFNNNVHDAWTATYTPTLSVNNMNIYQWMLQYTRLSATGNNPPVVTVGAAQSITNPTSTATLTGSATDSLGTITSHVWTFVSGPTTPVIASPASDTTAVSGLTVAGTYIFSLSVTDNRNLTVATNAQISVFPPPTGPNQLINVSLYTSGNPYVNSAWNDWNAGSSLSSAKFNYTNGNPSNISAVLSTQTAVVDNGTNYVTVTMCPEQAARYASYYSGSGGRTLTMNGLDSTKLYRLDFYATRNNPQQTTTFATAGTSVTVSTNNNTSQVGTIDNLKPVNGKIVVTITHGQYYDYLNGFTITEKTIVSNAPPVANAGPDQTITLPLDSVTLNGSASTGANPIVSYQWTILSSTAAAPGALESPTAAKTVLTNLAAGVYSVQLKVTDDSSHVGLDTVKVTVNPAPLPVANAGANQTITLPLDSVALNGSASTGSFIVYQWTILSGPGGQLTSPNTAATELDNLSAGTYLVGLTVTDIANNVSTATVQVIVNAAAPPPAPVAHAGADQTITLPVDSVILNGSASTAKDTIVAYQWTILSGNGGTLTTPDSVITTLTGLTAGTYMLQLQVTDDRSQTGLDTVQITVKPAPPPTANAGPNQTITLPTSSVTLNGSASTGIYPIVNYQWTVLSGPSGDSLTAPDSVITSLTGLTAGTYQVQLQVTDDSNRVGMDTVSITVNGVSVPLPPVVTVGSNQSIPTATTTLTATITAPQNIITAQQWTKLSAPGQHIMRIGVIGSSTLYGDGPTNIDSSLMVRVKRYYQSLGIIDTVYNLAVPGSTVYNGVTANFVSPGPDLNQYDSTANVTAALAKGINVLIVGYPSNDYQIGGLTIQEIMAAHQNIFDAANAAGVRCYITTSQPRTEDTGSETKSLVIADSLLNRFGEFCMDFMTPMVYPGTYTVLPQYSAGDGVHLSSAAHAQLANIVEATNVFKYLVSDSSVIVTPGATTTGITGLDSGVHLYQMGAFGEYKLASSAIISVTRTSSQAPPPLLPVANAGPDQTITLPTTTVTLAGSGSETGGKIVSFTWKQTAGTPTATIAKPDSATTNVTGLDSAGKYSFVLTVTDSVGAFASDTMNITVNPAPTTTTKVINVAIYGFSNPYNNSAWNAWNLGGSTLTSGIFKYSDGTTSTISAALSAQSAVVDNGPSYTVTMCPQQAARYPSYYSASGGRTLTLSGLDSTKTYGIGIYASRNNPSQTTTFTIGASSVTISTNNNTATVANFTNLKPASGGVIVIKLTHGQYYDYINGFTVTETTAVPAGTDPTAVDAVAPAITADTAATSGQALAIYPNPTRGSFELHVNNDLTGRMKVDVYTTGGVLLKEFVIAKTTTVLDTPLSLEGMQPGDYFLVATLGNWRRTLKLVKLQ